MNEGQRRDRPREKKAQEALLRVMRLINTLMPKVQIPGQRGLGLETWDIYRLLEYSVALLALGRDSPARGSPVKGRQATDASESLASSSLLIDAALKDIEEGSIDEALKGLREARDSIRQMVRRTSE